MTDPVDETFRNVYPPEVVTAECEEIRHEWTRDRRRNARVRDKHVCLALGILSVTCDAFDRWTVKTHELCRALDKARRIHRQWRDLTAQCADFYGWITDDRKKGTKALTFAEVASMCGEEASLSKLRAEMTRRSEAFEAMLGPDARCPVCGKGTA